MLLAINRMLFINYDNEANDQVIMYKGNDTHTI